jgi:hypothetical protein
MTLHSFLTSASDLSASTWRWTRLKGHALTAALSARTHAGACRLHEYSAGRPTTAIAVLLAGGVGRGAGAPPGLSAARRAFAASS